MTKGIDVPEDFGPSMTKGIDVPEDYGPSMTKEGLAG
jgi:hypothetical protein